MEEYKGEQQVDHTHTPVKSKWIKCDNPKHLLQKYTK